MAVRLPRYLAYSLVSRCLLWLTGSSVTKTVHTLLILCMIWNVDIPGATYCPLDELTELPQALQGLWLRLMSRACLSALLRICEDLYKLAE